MSIDTIIAIDWSARSKPSAKKPVKDAIYLCAQRRGQPIAHPLYFRTRRAVMQHLYALLETEMTAGRKTFVGFDFSLGYPQGFAKALTGKPEAMAVWDWLTERIEDAPDNSNNRFEVAAEINKIFAGPALSFRAAQMAWPTLSGLADRRVQTAAARIRCGG